MHIDPPRVRGLAWLVASLGLSVSLLGCPSRVEVSVQVVTDLAPGVDFDTVALERDEVPILTRAADASARFDRPVVLAELDDLPRDRTVRLGARLLLGETQVVSRAVVSRFDSSRVVLLVLSSACRTLRCPPTGEPDATECESGRCVRPVCEGAACGLDAGAAEDDAASPEPDAALDSLPDAVVEPDAEPIDAGSDAACAPAIDPCAEVTCSSSGWCDLGICFCDAGRGGAACELCEGWPSLPPPSPMCVPGVPIQGTDEPDTLSGTAADDYLRGLGGDDLVLAGGGSDFVNGNAGVDEIRGEDGPDVLFGGAEDDRVLGGPSDDFVSGDLGNDHVIGGGGTDRIAGGQGDDVLRGEEEDGSGFGNDRYWLDGLGNDEIIDTGGDDDVARCAPGVRVERDSRDGTDRLLSFSTGGSARIRSSAVERILGCGCAL
jgi:hypothetical protein